MNPNKLAHVLHTASCLIAKKWNGIQRLNRSPIYKFNTWSTASLYTCGYDRERKLDRDVYNPEQVYEQPR